MRSIIPFIISLVCLYLFYRGIDFSRFLETLSSVSLIYILLASLLLYISVYLRAIRWQILLKKKSDSYKLFKIQMIGYFGNNILPFKAGEILKSFLLGQNQKISKSYVLGTIVIERFLDVFMLLVMGIVCVIISPVKDVGGISLYFLLLIILGLLISFFIILFIMKGFVKIRLIENFLTQFVSSYSNFNVTQLIKVNILGFIIWIIYWINVELIFFAFDIQTNFYESLLVLIVASIINSVPFFPGAIGIFHFGVNGTLLAFSSMEDISVEAFTTILHGYGYILLTVIGLYYFVIDKKIGIKQLINFKSIKD